QIQIGETPLSIGADTVVLGTEFYSAEMFWVMLGLSAAMRCLFATFARLEGSLVTMLIGGESGVGKELIARAVYEGSPVGVGPLVIVNCGALSRELVASELFGHKRGVFIGATEDRKGVFELATDGMFFFDEIGELSIDV